MEKRRQQRSKQRLTCELVAGGGRHPAIVRDISPSGFFAQTRLKPDVDSVIEVVFPSADGRPALRVEAGVARHRQVPAGLERSVPSGVGLEVLAPPDAYRALVAASGSDPAGEPGGGPDAREVRNGPLRSFRVQLLRQGTASAKIVTVRCETAAGARARALARAGRGWRVSRLQEV